MSTLYLYDEGPPSPVFRDSPVLDIEALEHSNIDMTRKSSSSSEEDEADLKSRITIEKHSYSFRCCGRYFRNIHISEILFLIFCFTIIVVSFVLAAVILDRGVEKTFTVDEGIHSPGGGETFDNKPRWVCISNSLECVNATDVLTYEENGEECMVIENTCVEIVLAVHCKGATNGSCLISGPGKYGLVVIIIVASIVVLFLAWTFWKRKKIEKFVKRRESAIMNFRSRSRRSSHISSRQGSPARSKRHEKLRSNSPSGRLKSSTLKHLASMASSMASSTASFMASQKKDSDFQLSPITDVDTPLERGRSREPKRKRHFFPDTDTDSNDGDAGDVGDVGEDEEKKSDSISLSSVDILDEVKLETECDDRLESESRVTIHHASHSRQMH